jgi:hypothetical protein
MTRGKDDDVLYLAEDDVAAGHLAMAQSELRSQGCQHRDPDYSDDYDSYYCGECDVWAEAACGDKRCTYCATRPTKPSLANDGAVT